MEKERIDTLLVKKGYFPTRQKAQRSILSGVVFVNQERVDKVGTRVPVDSHIHIKGEVHPYVSRGGLKLKEALRYFSIDLKDKVMLDIGSSTGGFTDCALKAGAKLVYSIDVGYGQLAWSLRQDPRVIVMERTNFRYIKPEDLSSLSPHFATIDVSFISLRYILPALYPLLLSGGGVVALVKPQFEAGKDQVGKNGVVRDPRVHQEVLSSFVRSAYDHQFDIQGLTSSPIQGAVGNSEFLCYVIKQNPQKKDWKDEIDAVVKKVHRV